MSLWSEIKEALSLPLVTPPPKRKTVVELNLGEHDILCLTTDKALSAHERELIKTEAERIVSKSGRQAVLLEEGLKLSVIKRGEM